jgi:hypothetical protein
VFPCQKGDIFPDPSVEENRLRTFLYHHMVKHIDNKIASDRREEDDDEEVMGDVKKKNVFEI